MTDTAARIRAELDYEPGATAAWIGTARMRNNALRAVLEMCHNGDVALNGFVATDGIRYVVARELGVSQ